MKIFYKFGYEKTNFYFFLIFFLRSVYGKTCPNILKVKNKGSMYQYSFIKYVSVLRLELLFSRLCDAIKPLVVMQGTIGMSRQIIK